MRADPARQLLFVISGDYGELSNALYLLADQPFAPHATVALPPSLYEANAGALPCTARAYESPDDLIALVDAERPPVVFLFSGYLFSFSSPVTIDGLERLVASLRAHGSRIVTSDPFLGALGRAETAAWLGRLHPPFVRAHDLLKDAIHFYPAPCARLASDVTAMSAFNPRSGSAVPDGGISERFWLFVLSKQDYDIQVAKHGAETFVADVTRRLADASRLDRQPVLVGPPALVDALRARAEVPRAAVLRTFCAHDLFTRMAVHAEHAFYWNMFSNSIVIRFGNHRSTFFFDIGHLGRLPWLYELAVENYFLGWRPVCLDHRRELTPALLNMWTGIFRGHVGRVADHFRSSPPPADVVAALLTSTPGGTTVAAQGVRA